jgi:hypothetical protein
MRIKRYRLPVLALGGLLAVAGVGVASGAIPSSSDGVIHGCYQKPGLLANPGAVRVIDAEAGQTCRSNETAFQWNSKGPKGDPGPQGPSGVLSGRVVVKNEVTVTGTEQTGNVSVQCPLGKVVLTGGADVANSPAFARLTESKPTPTQDGWSAQAIEVNLTAGLWTLEVTAVCVDG